MSFNLVRNSRLFFTTNVDPATGLIARSGSTTSNSNTFEIKVLDGFSFTQSTQQTTIQISEAGNTPVRGQRAFNVSLDPVEITFSTYMRPAKEGGVVSPEEKYLWNALFSDAAIETGTALGGTPGVATYAAATGQLTIPGTGMAVYTVGEKYHVQGMSGTTAPIWNDAVEVVSSSATSLVLRYLDAPTTGTTVPTVNAAVKLVTSAYAGHAVAGANPSFGQVVTAMSNKNQLQKFGMIFLVDSAVYLIDNCVADSASIDFGLDGIATVAWTVRGTRLEYAPDATISAATPAVFGGTGIATGTTKAPVADPYYITNKLSTMQLKAQIGGGGTEYLLALTGGNLTISNNVNYITPANLGAVNVPIGYFTGSRSISGNVTAYLRVGANRTAQLLKDIVDANAAETKFYTKIDVGGASNAYRVEFLMNGVLLQIPTVETADVISTTINFTAQGHGNVLDANTAYDLSATNDLRIRYFAN